MLINFINLIDVDSFFLAHLNTKNFFINIFDIFLWTWPEVSFAEINLELFITTENSALLSGFNNLSVTNYSIENLYSIYNYSIPNTKLYYPEAFISSASFMHSDLWFMHILVYQYWLWFVFIFLIIFFFLMFLFTIRWCNLRTRPRRETRGVSRSKCADLITACVPVSWAASIIVNETTDAIDYFDGFGTTELAVGIRAYQWGWEYYYPKDLDLQYLTKQNYSSFIGNSLKYESTEPLNLKIHNIWKQYQNKNNSVNILPSQLIFTSTNLNDSNNINLFYSGLNITDEPAAFAKINQFSKNSLLTNIQLSTNGNVLANKLLKEYNTPGNLARTLNFEIIKPYTLLGSINTSNIVLDNSSQFFFNNFTSNSEIINNIFDINKLMPQELLLRKLYKFDNLFNLYANISKLDALLSFKNYLLTYFKTTLSMYLSTSSKLFNYNFNYTTTIMSNTLDKMPSKEKSLNLLPKYWLTKFNFNMQTSDINIYLNSIGTFRTLLAADAKNTINSTPVVSNDTQTGLSSALIYNDEKTSNFFLYNSDVTLPSSALQLNWNALLNKKLLKHSILPNISYLNKFNSLALSSPILYYDYDFRNIQTFAMMEDFFWNIFFYSFYDFEDYLVQKNEFLNPVTWAYHYKRLLPQLSTKTYWSHKTVMTYFTKKQNLAVSPIFTEFSIKNSKLTNNTNVLALIFNKSLLNSFEDSTLTWKKNKFYLFFFNNISFNMQYNLILNSKLIAEVANNFSDSVEDLLFILSKNTRYSLIKSSANLNIRKPLKSMAVNYNAIHKVFRARFDENRAHVNVAFFNQSLAAIPFIADKKLSYEQLGKKNIIAYSHFNLFKPQIINTSQSYLAFSGALNYYFFEFPLWLSLKSDAARYFWFDWYAKWDMLDVQPASHAKYGLYGLPFFSKNSSYTTTLSDNIQDSEMYFSRINQIRKNYITSFSQTPYFIYYNTYWNCISTNLLYINYKNKTNAVFYWLVDLKNSNNAPYNNSFSSSISNITSFNKNMWRPLASTQAQYYITAKLTDILVAREYLLRYLLVSTNCNINVPAVYLASSVNPITSALNGLIFYKNNLNTLSIDSYNAFLTQTLLNSSVWSNKFYTHLYKTNSPALLYKTQYLPMRKGVSNMIRLHATGAIAMPTETRLQILASSKDVIHSWAIPSAGIKIDCVPGYSSHKVAIFLVSGIYWGQCMEICGRYHHWMPIVAYFMKKDIFFLWCMHFIFLQNNNFTASNRDLSNFNVNVTLNKLVWLNEL